MKDSSSNSKKYLIIIWAAFCMILFAYLAFTTDVIPFMDYWGGCAAYIEHILNDPVDFKTIFTLPHGIHWNPFYSLCDYVFVRVFKCNNQAYIFTGMIFSFITFFLLIMHFNASFKSDNKKHLILGAVFYLLPVFNLNQWEILTISCNFQFMFRIMIYIASFILLDKIFKIKSCRKELIYSVLFGLINAVSIFCISQAYYPGFASALIFACTLELILKRKKQDLLPCIFIILCNASASVGCYMTTLKETAQVSLTSNSSVIDMAKGFILMLGATVTPTFVLSKTVIINLLVGLFILFLAVASTIIFFKNRHFDTSLFSIMCLVYAFVSIIIIIIGRMNFYGIETLGTSRYVVDTTIGLLGLTHIFLTEHFRDKADAETNKKKGLINTLLILSISGMILLSSCFELLISPLRKEYYHSLVIIAEDIDSYSDTELAIFNANPQDVRDGINIMKEYHLNLWSD